MELLLSKSKGVTSVSKVFVYLVATLLLTLSVSLSVYSFCITLKLNEEIASLKKIIEEELEGSNVLYENDDYVYGDEVTDDIPPYLRQKRDVVAETIDGVPINSESYATIKKINITKPFVGSSLAPIIQPGFHSPAWEASHEGKATLKLYAKMQSTTTPTPHIYSRKSRVMKLPKTTEPQFKKPIVKSLEESVNLELNANPTMKVSRHRSKPWSRIEALDDTQVTILRPNRKQMFAAHFDGDTSKYVFGQHLNFKGNGHLQHLDKTYVDWKSADWMDELNMNQFYEINNGIVTIKETGLYLVYSQIYYLDSHDTNGYRVYRNSEAILQCTTMTYSTTHIVKGNTCYTSGVSHLLQGDKISVRDLADDRYSLFEQGKSFFGVVKLADARMR